MCIKDEILTRVDNKITRKIKAIVCKGRSNTVLGGEVFFSR